MSENEKRTLGLVPAAIIGALLWALMIGVWWSTR
jgi:hypothetical protein